MPTRLEDLSGEIFLDIFDYLSTYDRFHGFSNLKWEIENTLKLTGLSIDLTAVSNRTLKEFDEKMIFTEHYQQIRTLKLSNESTIGLLETFFHQHHLRNCKQLRSLTLIKPSYMALDSLALQIPHLKQLEYLAVDSNSYPEKFFRSVTTKSLSLKTCYLPSLQIEEPLSNESNLEYLTVTVANISILVNLLTHFPQLKYLDVTVETSSRSENDELPQIERTICKHLQVFKLRITEDSTIDFSEISHCFNHLQFEGLRFFFYDCISDSLSHLDVDRWNSLLSVFSNPPARLEFFFQIQSNSIESTEIESRMETLQEQCHYPMELALSIDHFSYIIHSKIYPKKHFHLPVKSLMNNTDPLNCDEIGKYSQVQTLIVSTNSISSSTRFPSHISQLHLMGEISPSILGRSFESIADRLTLLRIVGFSGELPLLPNLRQLNIQETMFDMTMLMNIVSRCPQLQLLSIEIDSIIKFEEILHLLRTQSPLSELTFLRVFSRDPTETWISWVNANESWINNDRFIHYGARNLFLFIWF